MNINGYYPLFKVKNDAEIWIQKNVLNIIYSYLCEAKTHEDYTKMKRDCIPNQRFHIISIDKSIVMSTNESGFYYIPTDEKKPITFYIYNGVHNNILDIGKTFFGNFPGYIEQPDERKELHLLKLNINVITYHQELQYRFSKYLHLDFCSNVLKLELKHLHNNCTLEVNGQMDIFGKSNSLLSIDFHPFMLKNLHFSCVLHANDYTESLVHLTFCSDRVVVNGIVFISETIKTIQIGKFDVILISADDSIQKVKHDLSFQSLWWAISRGKRLTYTNKNTLENEIIIKSICVHSF